MPLIDLETAVDHILRACKAVHKKGHSPFFFLVGGGISFPPVPLASEIVEHCKAKDAKECARTTEPPGKQLIDIYSHWFDQAYPQPRDLQEYLRELIEGKPLSHANLYLAHLLLEKTITNLVVTPNFDDFLSRALTLFGKPHIVCDHPGMVGRIHPDHDDIQIIHVHGTYWFYDCCNLLGEIKERSQPSDQTSLTMASLLDRILWDRSPLVIGYGGWEGDVTMTALKRRLQSPLGHNVYWFCYRKAEVDSLPDWLRSNPQVNFVVPSPQEPSSSKKQNEPYLSAETKEYSGKERDQTALPAHLVLDKFIQKFSLESPELTRDPLGLFAKHLSHSLLQNNQDNVEDIYYIRSVIDGIKKAKEIYAEKISTIESQLESVRDAMRRSQYREAIELASKIEIKTVESKQLRGLMDAMWFAALDLSDNSNETLKGYDLVIVIGDILLGQNKDNAALRDMVARALFNKGIRLGSLNQGKEAIAVYDEVIKRFG
ncbi:MAG: SIR2 family protein, partial [Candidatus Brocadiaceae bacterium]|nr:SIR2 family protein [Candidatus Brocadiaceae bacterium]